jgi:hypothetical protein
MSEYQDRFLDDKDIEWEHKYFGLMNELKEKNASRYEDLAMRLMNGGEEFLNSHGATYKISVDKNGCGYSYRAPEEIEFQRISWSQLSQKREERIDCITNILAECEARAELKV